MGQAVNVGSLEEVIRHYLELATGRAEEAKKAALAVAKEREAAASQRELLREVGDLDEGDSPESLLLSYVSMDSDEDRISREQVPEDNFIFFEKERKKVAYGAEHNTICSLISPPIPLFSKKKKHIR